MGIIALDIEIDEGRLLEIVDSLIPHEELVDFVKALELEYADWDVTLDLCEHFAEQKRIYDEEVASEAE